MSDASESPEEFESERPFVSAKLSGDSERAPGNLAVLLVQRQETLSDLAKRLGEPLELVSQGGKLLIVFPKGWGRVASTRARQEFFSLLSPHAKNISIAGHDRVLLLSAVDRGSKVFETRPELKDFLEGHPHSSKALRHFTSEKWQEAFYHFLSRLKTLSVHRVSVTIFLALSIFLFLTVLFIAIPSARIRIWPTVNLVSYTTNVALVASGSVIDFDPKYSLPLLPVRSTVQRKLNFTEISKKFLGENAETEMTLVNESDEPYSLRAGTRLVNQAGMIFRTLAPVEIPAATPVEPGIIRVRAQANPQDLYGQIVGDRGNVPAGIKWEIPGLPVEERKFIYARNHEDAKGGVTKYGQELQEKDLELAKKQLEQELVTAAKERIDEEIKVRTAREGKQYVVLQYDVLTSISFSGFVMPMNLIGTEVTSIMIDGELTYTVLAYSKDALHGILLPGLMAHVEEGRELVKNSAVLEGISVNVIEYDDALSWVKITAELTGKQRSVLNPVSRPGRAFTERVRDLIRGKSISDAERIIQNFPEVERVQISVWPPWRGSIPSLMSNIVIIPQGL